MKQEIDNTQVEDKTDKSTSLGNNVVSELWPLVQNFLKYLKNLKTIFEIILKENLHTIWLAEFSNLGSYKNFHEKAQKITFTCS